MIKLPEAAVLARQINETLTGRCIARAAAGQSPHKFAWYTGDQTLLLSVPLRYHPAGEPRPKKHQLLLEFDDGSALSGTVQMWGGPHPPRRRIDSLSAGELDALYAAVKSVLQTHHDQPGRPGYRERSIRPAGR